jgi:hypothetical protein
MSRDIVEKIDELNELFAFAGAIAGALSAKPSKGESPALQSELSMLFSKVMDKSREIASLSSEKNQKKIIKKAVEVVIRDKRLNKNWAKLLKNYVKKYT